MGSEPVPVIPHKREGDYCGFRTAASYIGRRPAIEESVKATQRLHDLGQSLWLDNITRGLLTEGTLRRYTTELSVTGLTSNPVIFDHTIKNNLVDPGR